MNTTFILILAAIFGIIAVTQQDPWLEFAYFALMVFADLVAAAVWSRNDE